MSSQFQFIPSSFFALRTPLLPFDEVRNWGANLHAPVAVANAAEQPAQLETALLADRQQLRAYLQTLVARPEIREAIFVASPDLDAGLARWWQAPDSEKGQRVENTLVRYFVRMAGRATPFGLFSGCAVGALGERTELTLAERARYQRHTRLDMDYLFALCDALGHLPEVRQALLYRPNSSLYHAAGRLRYAEARLQGKLRSYHLVAVEENPYLAATLARAQSGATPASLATALVEMDAEITLDEAAAYVEELISSQLLLSDLTLAVTGPEPIHDLIAQLQALMTAVSLAVAACLAQTRDALAALDAAGPGHAPEAYLALARPLETLPTKVELNRLFQVDMVKPVRVATLNQAVIQEVSRGVDLLYRFVRPQRDNLQSFRDKFITRYEGREVPLVEVLDEELGIGFDNGQGQGAEAAPLLTGLAFPAAYGEQTTPWGARQALLLQKLEAAQQTGAQTIEITAQDVAALGSGGALPLPDAFSVMANLAAPSAEALAQGDFRLFLHTAGGPSGARLLGRFCHADPQLQTLVEQHVRAEEAHQPDALFAEVVHLPEGRIGNILCRPVLRGYEIPFLGRSGAAPDQQILITDLLVSVVNGEVILRSARLQRRVIPRLTSAHNYAWRGLGIYKFLCALQSQGIAAGLSWDWGALESAAFLPRVTSGKLVLSRSRWRMNSSEIKTLSAVQGALRYQAVQRWRTERQLPRFVVVADGDNELPIDLDNVLCIETLLDLVKGRGQATLIEMFPSPDELCATGPEGSFVHELVVPFVRTREEIGRQGNRETREKEQSATLVPLSPRLVSPHLVSSCPSIPRTFIPGSEWLYAKLYTGTATADQLLRTVVRPLTAAMRQSESVDSVIDQWFFIRYSDPEWHIRIRLHGEPTRLQQAVLPALFTTVAPLVEAGQLWRVQLDTYEREIERYGGPQGMLLAERLFHADSAAVLGIVELLDGDAGADARWRLALRGMDMLLNDLGFDLPTKQAVMRRTRDNFAAEFHADSNLRSQLGEKFRNERKSLEAVLDPAYDADSALAPGLELLNQRSTWLAPITDELRIAEQTGQLTLPLTALAPSYLHMHANRLLRAAQRAQEMVLYDFLDKLYESRLARTRQVIQPRRSSQPKQIQHPSASSVNVQPVQYR